MSEIFKIIAVKEKQAEDRPAICIGIDLRLGDKLISCPVSKACSSYEELASEA